MKDVLVLLCCSGLMVNNRFIFITVQYVCVSMCMCVAYFYILMGTSYLYTHWPMGTSDVPIGQAFSGLRFALEVKGRYLLVLVKVRVKGEETLVSISVPHRDSETSLCVCCVWGCVFVCVLHFPLRQLLWTFEILCQLLDWAGGLLICLRYCAPWWCLALRLT